VTERYTQSTYGDRIAETYDEWYPADFAGPIEPVIDFLAELAGEGPALELGIGTGRIALPLAERGVRVHGIDASEAMVGKLRAKAGGDAIPVMVGSFSEFELEARFRLVYVAFNTFFGLLSQEEQVSSFRSVARHLTDDGAFALEAFVPDLSRFDRGQRVSAISVSPDEVRLEVTKHDAVAQRSNSQHVVITEQGIRLFPVSIRYAHIAELDLMAQDAGLVLDQRWAWYDRTPFSGTAPSHVSVWRKESRG
jgi:SAM-dependent methyltransferase